MGSAASKSTYLTDPPDLAVLEERFTNGPDWYTLGVQLKIDLGVLNRIKVKTRKSPGDRLEIMFSHWLKSVDNPTWGEVIRCLKSLDAHGLANKLEEDYKRELCCI